MVLSSEGLVEGGINVGNDIVILPVVDGAVAVVECSGLGIFLREILVSGRFAVLVVQLCADVQAVKRIIAQ